MEKINKKWYKRIGWFGVIACGLCCTLPIIATLAGIGALTTFGAYSEKIGIVALGISGILFALYFYRKNRVQKKCENSCSPACGCKPDEAK